MCCSVANSQRSQKLWFWCCQTLCVSNISMQGDGGYHNWHYAGKLSSNLRTALPFACLLALHFYTGKTHLESLGDTFVHSWKSHRLLLKLTSWDVCFTGCWERQIIGREIVRFRVDCPAEERDWSIVYVKGFSARPVKLQGAAIFRIPGVFFSNSPFISSFLKLSDELEFSEAPIGQAEAEVWL